MCGARESPFIPPSLPLHQMSLSGASSSSTGKGGGEEEDVVTKGGQASHQGRKRGEIQRVNQAWKSIYWKCESETNCPQLFRLLWKRRANVCRTCPSGAEKIWGWDVSLAKKEFSSLSYFSPLSPFPEPSSKDVISNQLAMAFGLSNCRQCTLVKADGKGTGKTTS